MYPKKLKPERSKDMVNSGNFIGLEHFILPFIYLFHSFFFYELKYTLLFTFVDLKTLVSKVAFSLKMKMKYLEISKGNVDPGYKFIIEPEFDVK